MKAIITILTTLFAAQVAIAGSAAWNLNSTSSDWNTAVNWTPATVPNGQTDIATFVTSSITSVSLSANTEVDSIVFEPGASAFEITVSPNSALTALTLSGAGIVNNSGVIQNFVTTVSASGQVNFTNSATAGSAVVFTNNGGSSNFGPRTQFSNNSSAGSATFICQGGSDPDHVQPGDVIFDDSATAANGIFICHGGRLRAAGGGVNFFGQSTAANGIFMGEGGADKRAAGAVFQIDETATAGDGVFTLAGTDFVGAGGAAVNFFSSATAGNATLIANGGATAGGKIHFDFGSTTGGTARIEVFGNGNLDISTRSPGVTIGSLEGDGLVLLGANNLTIGTNKLSTSFFGIIQGSGSITKTGKGTLTLASPNTYTGGTTISQGTLRVTNASGSATGTGIIQVTGGVLGGTGIVAGETSLAGITAPAILEPSAGGKRPATLSIQSALHFKGSSFNYVLDTRRALGDQVVASGVSIENQDGFNFSPIANKALTVGQVFVAINNTAATPISGNFGNLPDGATFRAGNNTFQANYEGGDGNDLTLTVVP